MTFDKLFLDAFAITLGIGLGVIVTIFMAALVGINFGSDN